MATSFEVVVSLYSGFSFSCGVLFSSELDTGSAWVMKMSVGMEMAVSRASLLKTWMGVPRLEESGKMNPGHFVRSNGGREAKSRHSEDVGSRCGS